MNQRVLYGLRVVVGLVFMLSGILKSLDTAAFANLMSEYGPVWLGIGAPLLIAIEILLALCLLFNIHPRKTAVATIVFIVGVSGVYAYGILFRGITSCGCFGPLTWLNSKPWLTFTRNAVLVGLLIPSLFAHQQGCSLSHTKAICLAVVGVVLMFVSGFTFRGADCMIKESYRTFEPIPLADSDLADYIHTSPDSTYFVFAFSYTCPFCQNSVANVNQYLTMGVVDKVIGIALEDPEGRERFERLFDVDFEIQEISELKMVMLTGTLPTVWRIRHDSIINSYSGLVISPALFLK